jgi:hypothetical protein
MSTPPTGEDPSRGPAPDHSPTTPQQPGSGQPGPQQYGWPAASGGQQPAWSGPAPQPYGPGPYASQQGYQQQPGYGPFGQPSTTAWPPAQQPPDKTRKRLIIALEVVALAIVVGLGTLVYVLSSTRLDPSAVERDVAAQFEQREGVALDLECRHRMIVRKGADYDCKGTTADGEDIKIEITITNDQGAYTWAEKD